MLCHRVVRVLVPSDGEFAVSVQTPPPLRARGVSVQYGDVYGVRDVDVDLDFGEILGIIGPNGAGKTSLIECIEGLRKRSAGEISVLGLDPVRSRTKVASRIGVQLQDTSYPSRARVGELCVLFSSFYDSRRPFDELLSEFGLSDQRKTYVDRLSGGQRQKLSIVLALIGKPEVLFLDELTTGPRSCGTAFHLGLVTGAERGRYGNRAELPLHGRDRSPLRSGHVAARRHRS